MQPTDFLMEMRQRGGDLGLEGDSFRYRGEKAVLSPKVRAYIEGNRVAIREQLLREQAEREERAATFDRLLDPYRRLHSLALRDALPPAIVGFNGKDTPISVAVVFCWDWLQFLSACPPSDPFAEGEEVTFLRPLRAILDYVQAEAPSLLEEHKTGNLEEDFLAAKSVVFVCCQHLDGETICLASDRVRLPLDAEGRYQGCVVYRISEIRRLILDSPDPDALRAYHASKLGRAWPGR